jgi:hypothetical protein
LKLSVNNNLSLLNGLYNGAQMQQATCELLLLWLNIFEQFEWTEQY